MFIYMQACTSPEFIKVGFLSQRSLLGYGLKMKIRAQEISGQHERTKEKVRQPKPTQYNLTETTSQH